MSTATLHSQPYPSATGSFPKVQILVCVVIIAFEAIVIIASILAMNRLELENRDLYIEISRNNNLPVKDRMMLGMLDKSYTLGRELSEYEMDNAAEFYKSRRRLEKDVKRYLKIVLPGLGCRCRMPSVVIFEREDGHDVVVAHERLCPAGESDNEKNDASIK